MVSEFTLIEQVFRSGRQSHWPSTLVPNGDDASVHVCEPGMAWVVSTDIGVRGVHWPDNFPLDQGADRAVCAALSDLAAMGAEARLVWLGVMAPSAENVRLMGLGARRALERFGLELAGGDTVRAKAMAMNVMVAGILPQGSAMRRSAATIGDDVWLAGRVGFSAMGLESWLSGHRDNDLVGAFSNVKPMLETGVLLRQQGVQCCIDISDGLLQDAAHVAVASGLSLQIHLDACEGWPELVTRLGEEHAIRTALGGGEDYALLFTAPKHLRPSFSRFASRIGNCQSGDGVTLFLAGQPLPEIINGFDHFASEDDI